MHVAVADMADLQRLVLDEFTARREVARVETRLIFQQWDCGPVTPPSPSAQSARRAADVVPGWSACHQPTARFPVRSPTPTSTSSIAPRSDPPGTYLGVKENSSRLPDLSPAGQEAVAELLRATLARLDEAERLPGADSDAERRCARLLRERLTAELAVHEADEHLPGRQPGHDRARGARGVHGDPGSDRGGLAGDRPAAARGPAALAGHRESLALGLERKLYAAPRPTRTFVGQLDEWVDTGEGRGWFEDFAADGPDALRAELDEAARAATAAVAELRDWPRDVYAPAVADAPNTVGRERYARWSRYYNGTDLDLDEAYATAGRSTSGCSARRRRRPRRSCRRRRPRGWRWPTSTSTAGTSRAWTRSATCSRA
ncbi:hypothetical protein SALBM217S_01779 [Streptomyces griseoloalbus]